MKNLVPIFLGLWLALAFQASAQTQSITSQPQSITVNNASTATFAVEASGATNYQWQFNGSNIDGATNSTLTLEDVTTNQAGSYTVIVNGSLTNSPPATLTIVPGTIVRFTFSGFLDGSTSIVDVQLFNYDKPVTVQNFIHYITAGAYTNMFFDRCVTNFVLLGGDYGASNQTSTNPPISGWGINQQFTSDDTIEPPFPAQITNEFNYGPLIHNRFGTIAMALGNGPNTASSAFFFNLADNSANLDFHNGGFAVFGQILNGTNVLQYFHSLADGLGIATNGDFLDDGVVYTNLCTNVPVNYDGGSAPANANLVYCNFQLISPASDTALPVVTITSPTANDLQSNGVALMVQGTAIDTNNIGLAWVRCDLIPLPASDGTLPNNGVALTNYVLGTTNWSLNFGTVAPGLYKLGAQVQDEASNLSTEVFVQPLTNTALVINGIGTVSLTNDINAVGYPFQDGSNYLLSATAAPNWEFINWTLGSKSSTSDPVNFGMSHGDLLTANFYAETNAALQLNIVGPGHVLGATNGQPILVGTTFSVTAVANSGQLFYAWSNSAGISLNPVQTYTMVPGLTLTAIFIANNNPNLIAFTYPMANGIIGPSTNTFDITGSISNAHSTPVTVTCQIFSNSTLLAFNQPLVASGTTSWSIPLIQLADGSYTLVATATNSAGDSTLISEDFTVQDFAALQLIIVGNGTVAPVTNGEMLPIGTSFQVAATPGAGEVFFTWNDGAQASASAMQTFTMAGGLTLTATFVPSNTAKGISFTYPPANARLMTNTFPLRGRVASSFKPAAITCQIFQTNGLAVGPPMTTTGTTTWAVAVTNIPGGLYTVKGVATNKAGLSTIVSENFSVSAFAAATGTYSGLFICTNSPVAPTNSGFLTFTVEPSGVFSGRLVFPAYAPIPIYPTFFENIDFGAGFFSNSIANFHGNPLIVVISLDLINGTGIALGTISSGAWSSSLFCYRATTKLSTNSTPAIGKYMLSLQAGSQTNWPYTNGYASLAVAKNGVIALSGTLPDNTAFSQSARVSQDGVWPLFAIPAGDRNKGMIIGWETINASGSCNGLLSWYKAPNIGAYYTGGVGVDTNMLFNSTGTNYSPPAAGSRYSIVFEGGSIVPPLTNSLLVNGAGQFAASGSPSDKLKISLSANGVINGSILNANNTLRFKGAFVSPSQGGSGFILDAGGQTGCFLLELQ